MNFTKKKYFFLKMFKRVGNKKRQIEEKVKDKNEFQCFHSTNIEKKLLPVFFFAGKRFFSS